jgi:hypothetical protein
MVVQANARHAHGSTTERYPHTQKTSYPDAAELAEERPVRWPRLPGYEIGVRSEGLSPGSLFLCDWQEVRHSPGTGPVSDLKGVGKAEGLRPHFATALAGSVSVADRASQTCSRSRGGGAGGS